MLAAQMMEAVDQAPLRTLDALSRDVWRAHTGGLLTDDEAQNLAEMIHSRRQDHRTGPSRPVIENDPVTVREASGRSSPKPERVWSYFPRKRPQRSPDRARSIERRRTLAATSPLPPRLAAHFTTGELAVMRIVADEVRDRGTCTLSVPELAARSGVCASKVRIAVKVAASLGLIVVTERRVPYRPNLTNVIRIVSKEWMAWTARWKGKAPVPHRPGTMKRTVRTNERLITDSPHKTKGHGNHMVNGRKGRV